MSWAKTSSWCWKFLFVWLQTQNFGFLFLPTNFVLNLELLKLHMYDLDYIKLQQQSTYYKLSENIYFYQVIFNRFCFIIYFLSG